LRVELHCIGIKAKIRTFKRQIRSGTRAGIVEGLKSDEVCNTGRDGFRQEGP